MNQQTALKAIADETRMKILVLLLERSYCVRALARKLDISQAAASQHLKVLREAGLLAGEKKGYFMYYDVDRAALCALAENIEALASIKHEACTPKHGGCGQGEYKNCHCCRDGGGTGRGRGHVHHQKEDRCRHREESED